MDVSNKSVAWKSLRDSRNELLRAIGTGIIVAIIVKLAINSSGTETLDWWRMTAIGASGLGFIFASYYDKNVPEELDNVRMGWWAIPLCFVLAILFTYGLFGSLEWGTILVVTVLSTVLTLIALIWR
jgi:hypothetical protein